MIVLGFEPGSSDSEARVVAIRLTGHILVCKIPLLERALGRKAGQARCATIGHIV